MFGLRQAFRIAIGPPVSLLGALAAMQWLRLSLDIVTSLGLLIVNGILTDDAIVISENIATRRARVAAPIEAAVAGAREVAPVVLSAFATTAAVLGSLVFPGGRLGEMLSLAPLVMLLMLLVSFIEAVPTLPNHLSHGAQHALRAPCRSRDRAAGA